MILAAARVMLLTLLRDRGALALALILPPAVFLLFAAIMTGAVSDQLRLHVGVADLARTPTTARLVAALRGEPTLRITHRPDLDLEALRALVRAGSVDVGIALRADPGRGGEGAPILVVSDVARAIAAPIAMGQVQRVLAQRLPDVAIGRVFQDVLALEGITAEQKDWLTEQFQRKFAEEGAKEGGPSALASLFEALPASDEARPGGPVTYYAGAIAVLFLLFAALQGAMSLIDERASGIHDRLAGGPGGLAVVVAGKFAFLTGLGIVQAGLVFLTAALAHGVDVAAAPLPWLLTTALSAAAASGLALALCAACASRPQAQTLGTFGLIMLSAVGGSMIPRFLMPPWLQDLGWLTPNTWAIEAYQAALTPRAPVVPLLGAWAVLALAAALGLALAILLARRGRAG